MNTLQAQVVSIKEKESLHLIGFSALGENMSMISLGLNLPIIVGSQVTLGFKSLSVALSKNYTGELSSSNQLSCVICAIKKGEILSKVSLEIKDLHIESIITTVSLERMKLDVGDNVVALIKANDLSVLEILA